MEIKGATMKNIKATILWIFIIPLVLIIDFILYFIGIFNKDYRRLYIDSKGLRVIEKILERLK